MTINLQAGDKVKLNWRDDYSNGARTGVVMGHPTNNAFVIIVSDDTDSHASAYVYEREGRQAGCSTVDVTPIDEARDVWDALAHELRSHISWVGSNTNSYVPSIGLYGLGKKITAIKLLRAVSGLSLTDAKRAVETFAV